MDPFFFLEVEEESGSRAGGAAAVAGAGVAAGASAGASVSASAVTGGGDGNPSPLSKSKSGNFLIDSGSGKEGGRVFSRSNTEPIGTGDDSAGSRMGGGGTDTVGTGERVGSAAGGRTQHQAAAAPVAGSPIIGATGRVKLPASAPGMESRQTSHHNGVGKPRIATARCKNCGEVIRYCLTGHSGPISPH
jgi:hypothetical protein